MITLGLWLAVIPLQPERPLRPLLPVPPPQPLPPPCPAPDPDPADPEPERRQLLTVRCVQSPPPPQIRGRADWFAGYHPLRLGYARVGVCALLASWLAGYLAYP